MHLPPYRHIPPLEMTMLAGTIGHTCGVRVDGTSSRRFLRFLSLTGPSAPRVVDCPSGNTYKISVTGLAFCVIWHDKHSGDWLTAFATPPIRLCHWTRLRREGSEGSEDSEGSKGSKGGSGALRAQIIKKPAHAPRHFDRSEAEWRNLTPPWYMKHGDRRSLDSEHHGSASCLSPIAACGSARDDGGSG